MREILYRGKRLDNGEWVYGDLVQDCTIEIYCHEIHSHTVDGNPVIATHKHVVDPDTVGEYTGYKDKNGKKLFTEDIITIEGEEGYFEIIWDEEKAKFAIENDTYSLEFDPYLYMDITLIGSAHDNPDLLVEVFER